MKNIAVLIDFTEGSKSALKQGIAIAKKSGASLFGIHVVSSQDKVEGAEKELTEFIQKNNSDNLSITPVVGVGQLAGATNHILNRIDADLAIICTHGIKGMFQQIFGAQILKLVQAVIFPCLVISEHTKVDLSIASDILFPVGPHPEFIIKVKQTAKLAQLLKATVIVYRIDRGVDAFDELVNKNEDLAVNYFDEHNISYKKIIEDQKVFSVGFSRQTLEYATNNAIPIMSLMATVSKNDALFGVGDKENFLVNSAGVSIFTCND